MPVTTFFTTFIDLQNALAPTPGVFREGGHDYRQIIPEALRTVFRLSATEAQMVRVQQALRTTELRWEVRRRWEAVESMPPAQRQQARADIRTTVSEWVGHAVDDAAVEDVIGGRRPAG